MNGVNESSLFTDYVVLWIGLSFTNKASHLTAPFHLLRRSAVVLCGDLKVVLSQVKWKVFLKLVYFTKSKISQVFACVLPPHPVF